MLSVDKAKNIIKSNIPDGQIQNFIEYKDLYIFQVFTSDEESQFDPFYSVNKKTGVFDEFSILTDGDTKEIIKLFSESKSRESDKPVEHSHIQRGMDYLKHSGLL